MQTRLQQWTPPAVWLMGATASATTSWLVAGATPAYGQVTSALDNTGTVVIDSGNQFDISAGTQAGNNLFHRFEDFSLDNGQTANFLNDSSVLNIVGQVSGGRPSYIDGAVQVQGSDTNLYLINPAGVLFGANAQLLLPGSFTAATADQVGFDGDWLDVTANSTDYSLLTASPDTFRFTGSGTPSAVVNQGDLSVQAGESLVLLGGSVVSEGELSASGGEVGLVAVGGESTVRLGMPGSLLSLEVDEAALSGGSFAVTDLPTLLTGRSATNAQGAESRIDIRPDGILELANVSLNDREVSITGDVSTASLTTDGGTIALLGSSVDVIAARVDASGESGGTIRIGGGRTQDTLPAAELVLLSGSPDIRADGQTGTGGDVVIRTTDSAGLQGTVSARGATQGGFVEMLGRNIPLDLAVDASGQQGIGRWRLSQANTEIVDVATSAGQVSSGAIATALNGGTTVNIETNQLGAGDIILRSDIDKTISNAAGLTLSGRRFRNPNGSQINLEGTGDLAFGLNQVNLQAAFGVSSIENAIAAIGNTGGRRLLSLGAGTYEFSDAIALNTNVDIEGVSPAETQLVAKSNTRLFNIAAESEVALSNLTLTTAVTNPLIASGGIENRGALTVSNNHFIDNRALTGGAIYTHQGGVLTVIDSEFRGNDSAAGGGAISVFDAPMVSIKDTVFADNYTLDDGGALLIADSTATVTDSRFENNSASDDGGAVAITRSGSTTFTRAVFNGNKTPTGSGGAVNTWNGATVMFEDSELANNSARDGGGALSFVESTANINESTTITGNTSDAVGGGIYAYRSTLTLDNATVDANGERVEADAEIAGGGIYIDGGSLNIANDSTISNNYVSTKGGGIYSTNDAEINAHNDADTDVLSVSFVGNTSGDQGGAIYTDSTGSVTLVGATFSQNIAESDGGAIAHNTPAMLTIRNTSFVENDTDEEGGAIYTAGNSTTTIENGTFTANEAGENGGAIIARNGAVLTVSDSTFKENSSDFGGGILLAAGASGVLENVVVESNRATDGGGLALFQASATVGGNSIFKSNTSPEDGGGILVQRDSTFSMSDGLVLGNTSGDDGGGIYATQGSTITLDAVEISGNEAADGGGGLYASSGSTVLANNVQVSDNEAAVGGGLQIKNSSLTMTDSAFADNTAVSNGGALYSAGVATVASSLFERSQATNGGAIENVGTIELTNATLSGNRASGEGGAIRSLGEAANLVVRNSTITDNTAGSFGGGIVENSSQSAQLLNTIVAANTSVAAADVSGQFVDQGHNLIGQAEGAAGFTRSLLVGSAANPLNPRLAALADNGGSTKTHLLQTDSAAINAGANESLPAFDQRGTSRVVGAAVDIGAVELDAVELVATEAGAAIVPDALDAIAPNNPPFIIDNQRISELAALTAPSLETALLATAEIDTQAERDDATIQEVERTFGRSFEDYWDLPAGQDLSFREIQAILRRAQDEYQVNSAIIYAMFVPEGDAEENTDILQMTPEQKRDDLLQLLLVMPEGELVRHRLPVTRAESTRQVKLFRSNVSDEEDAFGYRPLAQQLYQWLLAPLEEELAAQGIQNLLYSLDTGLRTAPVTAMRDYHGFSLERYGISMVSTIGLTQTDFVARSRRPTVAMGVAEFDTEQPLPAVPIELDVVKDFVPASQTVLNEGSTRSALENIQTAKQPGILHLATHATFDQHSPESSYIHLWEESLSMSDFSDLDWLGADLELLILSACSTALSSPNAELGFAGLATAAGVDATVGSLWQVSDIGTLALMSEFYIQLESTSLRFEALRRAQLALLNGETRIENGDLLTSRGVIDLPDDWNLPENATLDHPFFWSAFTMVGNPW